MPRKVALIAGSNGIVGWAIAELLASARDWDIICVSRRPSPLGDLGKRVDLDLRDQAACRSAAPLFKDVTHLFYCARATSPDPVEDERINAAMFTNIVEAVEAGAANLAHIQVMQGSKWYGCHLGPYKTPAVEDDPRHLSPNFYYLQQDFLENRQPQAAWTWSALRPHVVWGITLGYPHSFVVLLAAYASLSKHLGLPLTFPGSDACFNSVSQATDARLLAQAMLWAATTPRCANNAFNIINGDLFRWRYLWPKVAAFFDIETGPVQPTRLAERVRLNEEVWRDIAQAHDLKTKRFSDLGEWAYFDFTLRFDADDISQTTKARKYGFDQFVDTEEVLMTIFHQLRDQRVIP